MDEQTLKQFRDDTKTAWWWWDPQPCEVLMLTRTDLCWVATLRFENGQMFSGRAQSSPGGSWFIANPSTHTVEVAMQQHMSAVAQVNLEATCQEAI